MNKLEILTGKCLPFLMYILRNDPIHCYIIAQFYNSPAVLVRPEEAPPIKGKFMLDGKKIRILKDGHFYVTIGKVGDSFDKIIRKCEKLNIELEWV